MILPKLLSLLFGGSLARAALELRDVDFSNFTLTNPELQGGCLEICEIAVPYLEACFSGDTAGCLGVCNTMISDLGAMWYVSNCLQCLSSNKIGVVSTEHQLSSLNGILVQFGDMCSAFGIATSYPGLQPFSRGGGRPSYTTISGSATPMSFITTTVTSGLLVEITRAVGQSPMITSGTNTFTFSPLAVSPTAQWGAATRTSASIGVRGLVMALAVAMGVLDVA